MRALAVGMVVIYHLYPSRLTGGFAGVDVFFVISGFLITGHLLREYHKTGRVALLDFWGRRAKRLVPAAALVLTVTWLVSRILLPVTQLADTASQIRASALYFQNWQLAWNAVDYLKADSAASPVQHFWSLSVEEQFYLGWPLLFLLAGLVALTARRRARRSRGHHVMLLLASAIVVGSLWYSVYYTHANPAAAYFVTTTRIWELALGGVIALLPARLSQRIGRFGLLGWIGLGLVVASAFVLSGTNAFPGYLAALPAGGAAALILGGSAAGRFGPHRLTSTRPMVFLGGISYSLYLWHWPLIVFYTTWSGRTIGLRAGLAIVVAAVLLSWLTKVWVEDKVRTASLLSGHGWRSVSTALAAVVPVVLVSVFIATEPGPWNGHLGPNYPGAAALASKVTKTKLKPAPVLPPPAGIKLPAYWQQGCLVAESSPTPKECVYGDTSHPKLTVALVGDSMAGDWFTPLQKIAVERHWKLVTELRSVCPLTSTMMITPDTGGPYTACHAWGAAVVHDLATSIRPDVVITSDYPGLATVAHPAMGAAAQADIGAGMAQYWKQLQGDGMSVIAIKESPDVRVNVPACLAKHTQSKCAVPKAKAVEADPPTVYATQASSGTVPLIDMDSLICGPATCPPVVGNVLVYQDSHHLTSAYALTTAPYLEKRLLKVSKTLSGA
jgi:peptidoglycan/LPS O-acetylase OafA/YrhL